MVLLPIAKQVCYFDRIIYDSHFSFSNFVFHPLDDISALNSSQAWLAWTIQKLDAHLLGVCQIFNEENYLNVSLWLSFLTVPWIY
jgi:hypothetical protein